MPEVQQPVVPDKVPPIAKQDGRLRILLVEDSESDVYMLSEMLEMVLSERGGFHITDVPRLVDAFKVIERRRFDIIMLDLNLLDIQGIASVAALCAEASDTPIIVYSGMDDPRLRKEALLCGAQYYLVKGRQTAHSLREAIEDILSAR